MPRRLIEKTVHYKYEYDSDDHDSDDSDSSSDYSDSDAQTLVSDSQDSLYITDRDSVS
jgi:hypothetical protein